MGTASGGGAPAGSADAGEVVLVALRELTARFDEAEERARRDEDDAVHQLRVLVRRLRSILSVYRSLFDRERVRVLRAQLRELGQALGTVRDLEVLAQRAENALAAPPGESGWEGLTSQAVDELWSRHRRAHARLVGDLDGPEHARLRRDLEAFVHEPPLSAKAELPAAKALTKTLRRAAREVLREAGRLHRAAPKEEALLHEVRKSARRLRYAAEAVAGAEGVEPGLSTKRVIRLAAAGERLQVLIGEHRDDLALTDFAHVSLGGERPIRDEERSAPGKVAEERHPGYRRAVRKLRRARRALR